MVKLCESSLYWIQYSTVLRKRHLFRQSVLALFCTLYSVQYSYIRVQLLFEYCTTVQNTQSIKLQETVKKAKIKIHNPLLAN